MGLSCGVVCVILRLAVLIQYLSVTDTHTHRHTTTANTALSIASRGKNQFTWENIDECCTPAASVHRCSRMVPRDRNKVGEPHTFVVIEKLFSKYRNVERGYLVVSTLSLFTTARLSTTTNVALPCQQLGMSEKCSNYFSKYADHNFAKYAAKICGNRPQLHIHVNLTWYVFLGGWDSTAVI